MKKPSDFVPTMVSFTTWYLRTLDPQFVKQLSNGRTIEDTAEEIFDSIAASVRGNRADNVQVFASDYGAIMDRIAALHLRTRHGEEAVSQDAVPFALER